MKIKIAPVFFLAVLFGIAFFSCKTVPDKSPAVGQVNIVGTEWDRVNPPVERYTLVFVDKSNCMYVYPNTIHKRTYAVEGNKITVENDAYVIEGDILYYMGEIYFVKINKE